MHPVPEHEDTPVRSSRTSPAASRRRGIRLAGLAVTSALALSSCQGQLANGYLPEVVSDTGQRVKDLWIGSWIATLVVGAITWGLMLYAAVRYRKRQGDETLPPQLRYNVPVEILYTVIPLFMVAVFFWYTERDTSALTDTSQKPDLTISVVAKQWSWDFNYIDSDVHETGAHVELDGKEGAVDRLPVLYLPVDKRVEFVLNARDVIHSFWVPAFMTKLDMLPGQTNKFQVTPTEEGEFMGKCAELCGAYHSQMLFKVKVVSQQEYDKQMAHLEEIGQTGLIPVDVSREKMVEKDAELVPAPALTGEN